MLTSADLAYMRESVEQLYPSTCNILSLGGTSDGAGGIIETWGTLTASVPCRVDYMQGRESVTGGALVSYQKATISMAFDVVVSPSNRIEVGSYIFTVQAGNAGQSWKTDTILNCELV